MTQLRAREPVYLQLLIRYDPLQFPDPRLVAFNLQGRVMEHLSLPRPEVALSDPVLLSSLVLLVKSLVIIASLISLLAHSAAALILPLPLPLSLLQVKLLLIDKI